MVSRGPSGWLPPADVWATAYGDEFRHNVPVTDKQLLESAVFTLVVAVVLLLAFRAARGHSQFWTILSAVVGILSLLAAGLQFAIALSPSPSTPKADAPKVEAPRQSATIGDTAQPIAVATGSEPATPSTECSDSSVKRKL